jgi:hypothetical protein
MFKLKGSPEPRGYPFTVPSPFTWFPRPWWVDDIGDFTYVSEVIKSLKRHIWFLAWSELNGILDSLFVCILESLMSSIRLQLIKKTEIYFRLRLRRTNIMRYYYHFIHLYVNCVSGYTCSFTMLNFHFISRYEKQPVILLILKCVVLAVK